MKKVKDQFQTELLPIDQLKPHPQNYREHPADQLEHLAASIQKHGFYRNVVIAQDNTILAGHGVVLAAQLAGLKHVPAVRLPIPSDSIQALEVLAGDNEIEHLANQDDRLLSELLKQILDENQTLLGTGYDESMLAGLVMVTRPEHEIAYFDEAAHWVGMPEYDSLRKPPQLVISFENDDARQAFLDQLNGVIISGKIRNTWSMWWPPREREDLKSLKWEG